MNEPKDLPDAKRVPGYLLVTRYGSLNNNAWHWQYLPKIYDTLEDALHGLNWQNDKGEYTAANQVNERAFVGLWELHDDAQVAVSSEDIVHVTRQILEHRSNRIVWTVAPRPS